MNFQILRFFQQVTSSKLDIKTSATVCSTYFCIKRGLKSMRESKEKWKWMWYELLSWWQSCLFPTKAKQKEETSDIKKARKHTHNLLCIRVSIPSFLTFIFYYIDLTCIKRKRERILVSKQLGSCKYTYAKLVRVKFLAASEKGTRDAVVRCVRSLRSIIIKKVILTLSKFAWASCSTLTAFFSLFLFLSLSPLCTINMFCESKSYLFKLRVGFGESNKV